MSFPRLDDEKEEVDVRYGIDVCRQRIRSQRVAHRALNKPPADVIKCEAEFSAKEVRSYAEILATVSMKQDSVSRLVDCLLGPTDENVAVVGENVEAAIT